MSESTAEQDALREYTGLSRGRFGRIAPERIAHYVLAHSPQHEPGLRRAAFDALMRRYAFGRRDGLRVASQPSGGILGVYRTESTGKADAATRPYETALYSLEPLHTSCGCPDFVRSSLGLCKHGLVVLEALERRESLGAAAISGEPVTLIAAGSAAKGVLRWDYAQPLRGAADRLARVRYVSLGRAAAPSGMEDGAISANVLQDVAARLALITALERALARGALAAEPALATLLREERARAELRATLAPQRSAVRKSLGQLRRKLYPYQREGVERFFESGRLLLADDMGLGKTTEAIAICHALFDCELIERGVLIVPNPLKAQWQREWQACSEHPLIMLEGSPRERKQLYQRTRRGVLVLGYEQLLRDLPLVQGFGPELVVLDEAQRIKNWASKSAAYVKSLAPPYRLVLTGTPLENRFDELASIMDFVDDVALEPKWRLLPLHTVTIAGEKRVAGARNLDVLRQRLSGVLLRRVRHDVLTQLPSRTDTRIPVELSEAQRARHDDLRQPIAELSARAERRGLSQPEFLRLMQLLALQRMICNGLALVQFDSEWPRCEHVEPTSAVLESLFAPKLSVLRALVEQVVLAQQRKAVVFSQWRNMLRLGEWAVRDLLQAAGMRALFFTGAETPKQREQALEAFNEQPAVSMLFLSDAGGVGLNLQRAASCCINLELPWNPAVLEQRIGRIHRLGQKAPIDVYNLVCEEGIEGRIAQLIEQKRAVFSSLFDGTSDEVVWSGQASFLEGVKKLVEAVPLPSGILDAAVDEVALTPSLPPPPPAQPSSPPMAAASAAPVAPEPKVSQLAAAGLKVTRLPDGGLRIEAPRALADQLSVLLESLASSLRDA
jgi:superfamily II DNA or RNA helicase